MRRIIGQIALLAALLATFGWSVKHGHRASQCQTNAASPSLISPAEAATLSPQSSMLVNVSPRH